MAQVDADMLLGMYEPVLTECVAITFVSCFWGEFH